MAEGLRIAVIGAGIVGTSCAFFLQRDGHRVTLVDPREPGTGTSFGNAGIISLGSLAPVLTPALLRKVPGLLRDPTSPLAIRWRYLPRLVPWLLRMVANARPGRVDALARAIAALIARADAAHDTVIQECGLGGLVRTGGWLKVAREKRTLLEAIATDRIYWERFGRRYVILERAELRELEPALAPDLEAGVLLPENRAVRDPCAYVQGIARAFFERGGTFLRARADGFAFAGNRIVTLATTAGKLPVDAVVLAAGAFSKRLAALGGVRPPLDTERGYHVMLPHPPATLSRPVYSFDHGFILAPMEGGIRITGGVELASPWAKPDYRRIRRLVPLAQRLLPGLSGEILSEWLGFRPTLPDSLPAIGPSPRTPNLFFAFGHQHIGLTLGPLTGRLIADLVAGRDPGLDLSPYSPARFL
ncbi:MAG: FAD-binding oxidoreductase [Geminicoccaceae bacterium]|nr:FAD-binding oxidoreductase [Geminicoccaceae bacterium]MCS7269246.1 FAD-binding oxidoreductase [Geminicoccaceae bacterium]MCX7631442.1 FAD-binding oxidoreductase [Geminicoccaceae bacterium]MDW8125308.1 FAD-binding oxidoreductase [Geminicoccaceae bacterium]MDW8342449.1 FAD-binding oxidoreductase [Geminicoccaceae bacterium]